MTSDIADLEPAMKQRRLTQHVTRQKRVIIEAKLAEDQQHRQTNNVGCSLAINDIGNPSKDDFKETSTFHPSTIDEEYNNEIDSEEEDDEQDGEDSDDDPCDIDNMMMPFSPAGCSHSSEEEDEDAEDEENSQSEYHEDIPYSLSGGNDDDAATSSEDEDAYSSCEDDSDCSTGPNESILMPQRKKMRLRHYIDEDDDVIVDLHDTFKLIAMESVVTWINPH